MKAKRLFGLLLALTVAVSLMSGICLTASAVEEEADVPVIEISGIPEAVIGERILGGKAIVPEGAKYSAEYSWRYAFRHHYENGEWGASAQGFSNDDYAVFEDGKDYALSVDITLDDSWEGWEGYTEGEIMDVIISVNGGQRIWKAAYQPGNEVLWYNEHFCFSEPITSVELFDFPKPMPGEVAAVDGITVPTDAHYSILVAEWKDVDVSVDDSINGQVFETGGRYRLDIDLVPDAGYHFTEDCVFHADGVEYIDYNSYEPGLLSPYIEAEYAYGKINSVDISYNDAEPVVGEQPDYTVEVPEGANYWATIEWCEVGVDGWCAVDAFEFDKEYVRVVAIHYNEGYRFAEDAVVTANGQVPESDSYLCDEYGVTIYDYCYTEGYIGEESEDSAVWEIELSGLQKPDAGEPLSKNVSILTDGCTITGLNWYVWENDEWISTSGVAKKGKEYKAEIILTANEGYAFNMDGTGFRMDGEWMNISWIGEDEACVYMIYNNGKAAATVAMFGSNYAGPFAGVGFNIGGFDVILLAAAILLVAVILPAVIVLIFIVIKKRKGRNKI